MTEWETLKEKGNIFFKSKNYERAIDLYNEAIKLSPEQEVLYSNKGTCLKCLGRYKEAIKDYKKSLEINPKNVKNIKRLESVYLILGNYGESLILLEKCANLEPRESSHKNDIDKVKHLVEDYELIKEYKIKEDWNKVEEICLRLLNESSEYTELKLEYINCLIENVKLLEAISFIQNKVTTDERIKYEEFDYYATLCLYYDGQYDKAKKQLLILQNKSNDSSKYNDLKKKITEIKTIKDKSTKLFKEGKYNEAIEEYTKLLEFDPKNKKFTSIIYANRAFCYKKQNKITEALKDTNSSIKLNPNYIGGYLKRGKVYEELKMYDDARNDYSTAKKLDPSNQDAINYLNYLKNIEKQVKKRDYYKILEIDRNADEKTIKKAYRKMALKYHPDRNSESEESKKMAEKKFIDVNDAYNVLSDPKKKRMFDQGIDPLNPEEAQSGGMDVNFGDASNIFRMFFRGGGGPQFQFFQNGRGGRSQGFPGGFEFTFH